MGLSPCIACGRHIRETDACPFCSAKHPKGVCSPGSSLAQPVKSVLAAVVLAAGCGGSAAKPTQPVGTPPPDAAVGAQPGDAATEEPAPDPIDRGDMVRPLYGVDRN